MTIFLLVLKIIALVLLGIVGLLIGILLIFLLTPFKYKINASYDENISFNLKLSYLIHIITIRLFYTDKFNFEFRLLGFKVKSRKKEKEPAIEVNDNKESVAKEIDASNEAKKEKEDNKLDKLVETYELINSDSFKKTVSYILKRIRKMFILPQKVDISINYGLSNPSYTGMIMGLYEVFYNYFGKCLKLIPNYKEDKFSAKAYIKGRIVPITIVHQFICIIVNKDCIKLYKTIRNKTKREES